MSGDIHSGVQDIVERQDHSDDDHLKPLKRDQDSYQDELIKGGTLSNNILSSQLSHQASTASNTSDGSLCCEICSIRVTSVKILQRHLEGRKHKSRAERRGKTFHCDLCDVTANSEIQLNIHLSSSKHKSRVAREEYKEFFDVSSYSKSMYVLVFAVFCIILNLIILVKVAM